MALTIQVKASQTGVEQMTWLDLWSMNCNYVASMMFTRMECKTKVIHIQIHILKMNYPGLCILFQNGFSAMYYNVVIHMSKNNTFTSALYNSEIYFVCLSIYHHLSVLYFENKGPNWPFCEIIRWVFSIKVR